MQPDLFMPLTASLPVVLGVFFGCLLVFDLVLVRWLKLGKVAWKRVDYIWLGFGVVGLLGAVAQVRMASASAQINMHESRAVDAFNSVKNLVELYASNPGAICRTFVRSEYSPPPDEFQKIQNEYNVTCSWTKQMRVALAKHGMSPPQPVDQTTLPLQPKISDVALNDMLRDLDHQFSYFDQEMETFDALHEMSNPTFTEKLLVYLGPFLLAIALAIRITKVTGEIKLES